MDGQVPGGNKKDIMVSRGHIDTPLNVRVETCHPKHVCNVFFFFWRHGFNY